MSVLHTILLVVALLWSWCSFNTEKNITDVEHSEIQYQVKEFITNYIKENKRNVESVSFNSLYSKPLENGNVEVFFSYKIKESQNEKLAANLELTGKITLSKNQLSESDSANEWGMESLSIDNENIEFTEPLVINSEDDESEN